MVEVRFTALSGAEHVAKVSAGENAMEAGRNAMIPGIIGECGGCANCATCHVYVAEDWIDRLAPPEPAEAAMLEHALYTNERSRLSCQIVLTAELDGLQLEIAPEQF